MKEKLVSVKFEWAFFILSFLYLIICAMQCFDLADEGFFLSACQWYGTDISYAKCASGYPLSCYIGWLLYSLIPSRGLLIMRFWGILFILATALAAYFLLRNRLPRKLILIGIMLQTVLLGGDSRMFGYNTLTAFFGVLSVVFLIEGALRRKSIYLIIAGMLIGLNILIRLPNIVFLSLLVMPLISSYTKNETRWLSKGLILSIWVLCGAMIGGSIGWMILRSIGADQMVINYIEYLTGQLGETSNTHNAGSMLSIMWSNLNLSIITLAYFFLALFIAAIAFSSKKRIINLAGAAISLIIIYRTTFTSSNIFGDNVIALMNGVGLIGSCYFINGTREQRSIAVGAILLALLCPLGSDRGFQTVWNGTWLALPVGICGIYWALLNERLTISSKGFTDVHGKRFLFGKLEMTETHFRHAFAVALISMSAAIFAQTEFHSFFDPESRIQKTAPITSPMSKGIFTAAYKAERVNPLLKELSKHVKPNDLLLVYDFSPTIYFLTQTRPFGGISWPCMYSGKPYEKAISEAVKHEKQLPVIVLQYFPSTHAWWRIIEEYFTRDYSDAFTNPEMNRFMLDFMKEHGYKQVWSNQYYTISLPEGKNQPYRGNE